MEVSNRLDGILNTEIQIADKQILDKLQKLKTNKAAGPDDIFTMVIKELSEIILNHWQAF